MRLAKLTKIFAAVFFFMLVSCSSNPVEEYVDYFYSQNGEGGSKSFTYILYLGEQGKSIAQHKKDHASISPEQRTTQKDETRRRSSASKKEDDFTSLSFRMEEEAFNRLTLILESKSFCEGELEYQESEYTWLRYTIKGKCNP